MDKYVTVIHLGQSQLDKEIKFYIKSNSNKTNAALIKEVLKALILKMPSPMIKINKKFDLSEPMHIRFALNSKNDGFLFDWFKNNINTNKNINVNRLLKDLIHYQLYQNPVILHNNIDFVTGLFKPVLKIDTPNIKLDIPDKNTSELGNAGSRARSRGKL